MSELTKEFERIIEDTSGGLHNSQWWWDEDYADDGVTIIDGLCRRLESAAMKFLPTLPPVSPEDLVDGEWYAWKSAGNIHVGQVYSCGTNSTYIRCGATGIPVMDWNLYYGPLKFTIGGAK